MGFLESFLNMACAQKCTLCAKVYIKCILWTQSVHKYTLCTFCTQCTQSLHSTQCVQKCTHCVQKCIQCVQSVHCVQIVHMYTQCTLWQNVHRRANFVLMQTGRAKFARWSANLRSRKNGFACGRFCAPRKMIKIDQIFAHMKGHFALSKNALHVGENLAQNGPNPYSIAIFQNPRALQKLVKIFWKLRTPKSTENACFHHAQKPVYYPTKKWANFKP